jgi:replicative DNA helicase
LDKYQQQFENECYTLGCFIKEPSLLTETRLKESNYFNYNNKMLFKKLMNMKELGESIDLISLSQSNENDLFAMGGKRHIREVYDCAISIHSFKHYENLTLQFMAIENSFALIEDFKLKTNDIHRVSDLNNLIDGLQNIDTDIGTKEKTFFDELSERVEEHQQTPAEGLSGADTGFRNINDATDGFQEGDLIIMAARPSMGKTAVTLNMNNNGIKSNKKQMGTYVTAEMAKKRIIDREIALESGIPVKLMKNPNKYFNNKNKYWDKYRMGIAILESIRDRLNIWREANVNELRSKIRKLKDEYPDMKHIIYIDHLSHLKINGKYANRNLEVGAIVQYLKDVAVDYDVAIVLLCQLNRGTESQDDKRPKMANLRDSGEIEQIADIIMFIYREDYYHRNEPNYVNTNITELLVEKDRQGEVGIIELKFDPPSNRFYDI